MDPIHISFTYERAEYLRAIRRHYPTGLQPRWDLFAATASIALGSWLLFQHGVDWMSVTPLVVGTALLAMTAYGLLILPRIMYSSQSKLKQSYDLTFVDDGLRFKTAQVDAKLEWSLYERWQSDAEFYVLFHGKRDATVIPRRAFATPEADDRFRELLLRRVGTPTFAK